MCSQRLTVPMLFLDAITTSTTVSRNTPKAISPVLERVTGIGQSDIFVGREDGVNEEGLAIAMTGVAERIIRPGINFAIAIRCVLDRCASVEESIKALSEMRFSTTNSYLLADKEGNLAVVEASPDKVRTRGPGDGESFIIYTNHFLHPEMLEMKDQNERSRLNWDSVPRYTTIYNALKHHDGKIDAKTAQKILSNHSGYVCSHQESIHLGTLWSVITTLKKLQILRAEGHPCKTKYREDNRLNKVVRKKLKEM